MNFSHNIKFLNSKNGGLAISILAAALFISGCQPSETSSSTAVVTQSDNNSSAVAEGNSVTTHNEHLSSDNSTATRCRNDTLIQAFQAKQSERQVQGCGTIIKALPDDNEGSRHQKILIELTDVTPKQTLLLVHNIDLAPRVADVAKGTPTSFYGEYIYNDKGGLVHWTHHDPAARHQGGWIDSNGVRYE